jgi:hypothetical protein
MPNKKRSLAIEPASLAQRIFIIRGQRVMVDWHLAELYQVPTMRLNEQVKRNKARFPEDFMFQITKDEFQNLISQFAISSSGYGGRRQLPYAFTEHGVAMLSSVLRSGRAVEMNIFIIRAFIKLREMIENHRELAVKLEEIERKQSEQGGQLRTVYEVVKQLIASPSQPARPIGFDTGEEAAFDEGGAGAPEALLP